MRRRPTRTHEAPNRRVPRRTRRAAFLLAGLLLGASPSGCGGAADQATSTAGTSRGPVPTGSSELGGSVGVDGRLSLPGSKASRISVPARIDERLQTAGAEGTVTGGEDKPCALTVVVPTDTLGFGYDSSAVSPEGREILDILADEFEGAQEIHVEGHASSEGGEAYNLTLSQNRADAVKMAMEKIEGYAGVAIVAIGRGEEVPVASNETEGGRARNRRVEVHGEVERRECDEEQP